MKRFSILITCVFLCFAYSAASAWAIWEGNAGIAAASEFPGKGMYAKSDMFPKNTVVLIENLETGIKVRAVVTGSSGISGLVAVLSPETAAALNIRSGSVSRVRISIPSVVSEKSATGVAGTEAAPVSADPDVNPAVAAGAAPIPLESIANAQENPLVPLDADKTAATPEPAAVTSQPTAATSQPTAAVSENVAATESDVTPRVPDAVAESAEPAESVAPAAAVAPVAVAPVPESSDSEAASNGSDEVPANDESAAVAEPDALAPEAESQTATSPAFYDEPELAASEPPAQDEETLPVEDDSVALVPTGPNPPARSDTLDAAALSAASAPVAASAPTAVTPAPVVAPAAAPVSTAPVAATSDAAANGALAALPCVPSLAKGSYYVQIASYSDPIRAKKVVDGYALKYPIVVEQGTTSRGSVLKICVGPVKKDEYGAILERFKSLGFKDAFVRKGE